MLDYFVATGGNFINTANAYSTTVGSGETEEILKRWLRMQGCEDIIIATKLPGPMGGDPVFLLPTAANEFVWRWHGSKKCDVGST